MNMTDAIRSVYSKYATFSGRARRSEFWFYILFYTIIGWVIGMVAMAILFYQIFQGQLGDIENEQDPTKLMLAVYTSPGLILCWLWWIGNFIPTLAVTVRRLHDVGKSGWFLLIFFISYIVLYLGGIAQLIMGGTNNNNLLVILGMICFLGIFALAIYFLVLLCRDSQPGPNKYGLNPKGIGDDDTVNLF